MRKRALVSISLAFALAGCQANSQTGRATPQVREIPAPAPEGRANPVVTPSSIERVTYPGGGSGGGSSGGNSSGGGGSGGSGSGGSDTGGGWG
jgi:uncharacterized membrane protein YgcG